METAEGTGGRVDDRLADEIERRALACLVAKRWMLAGSRPAPHRPATPLRPAA